MTYQPSAPSRNFGVSTMLIRTDDPVALVPQIRAIIRSLKWSLPGAVAQSRNGSGMRSGRMLRVECPRCGSAMQQETFDGRLGRSVAIDICHVCQSFWFDTRESVALTPGATLALFRIIGERLKRPSHSDSDLAKCPRCKGRLRRTHDMQRMTKFEYLNCPNGHGRLISFFDFLREKDFIRPLTAQQIAELRENVGAVNCANCGGSVDLARSTACTHCGSPLSMLDIHQAETLVSQLQKAEDRANQPVDPALPLQLLRARRETERAFAGLPHDDVWVEDVLKTDLVGAGLSAVARWLRRRA